jgi:uncharacterized protein
MCHHICKEKLQRQHKSDTCFITDIQRSLSNGAGRIMQKILSIFLGLLASLSLAIIPLDARAMAAASVSQQQEPGEDVNAPLETGLDYYNAAWESFEEGNLVQARKYYESACGLDEGGGACNNLALMLRSGEGGATDNERARVLFQKSCKLKYIDGCVHYALMLSTGAGGNEDDVQARKILTKHCKAKDEDPNTCYNLGVLLRDGQGGKPKHTQARALFVMTCEKGYASACNNLALMIQHGKGGPADLGKARGYFRQSCDLDDPDSNGCHDYAVMLLDGKGGASDRADATIYFKKACDLGLNEACDALKTLQQS